MGWKEVEIGGRDGRIEGVKALRVCVEYKAGYGWDWPE